MKEFEGIDLNDSFVLSWEQIGNHIIFNLEASIWPESKHYSMPKPDEYTCYKPARLVFGGVSDVSGLSAMENTRSTFDPDNEVDYGNIDDLVKTSEGFLVYGDFGEVVITGGSMRFEIGT